MTYEIGDHTPIPLAEIDWSLFDPDRIEHVQTKMLAGPIAAGAVEAHDLAACLYTYGRPEIVRPKSGSQVVDISGIGPLRDRAQALRTAADAAQYELRQAMIAAYQAGATAPSLARASGLSLPRVHQIVAGSRSVAADG